MKLTNIGVQIMPVILAISSVFYYMWQAYVLCALVLIIALIMWLVLFGETKDFTP